DTEPILVADQQGVQHLRAPSGEERADRLREGLGRRLGDVEGSARCRQVKAAAAVEVADALVPEQFFCSCRQGFGDQERQAPFALAMSRARARIAELPDYLPGIAGKDGLPGLDEQDEGLPADMQIDFGVMASVAAPACRCP